jgi:hypothetical protein
MKGRTDAEGMSRLVSRIKGHPDGASKPSGAGTASPRGPQSQWNATDAWGESRDVAASGPLSPEMEGGRLQMAVVEIQIDNIHLELDSQMYRTAQLETLLTGVQVELHELIQLVTRLRHEVVNKPASVDRSPGHVVH